MKIISKRDDLSALPAPQAELVRSLWSRTDRGLRAVGFRYVPSRDGHIVVVQEGDTARDLRAAGLAGRLQDSTPETVEWFPRERAFVALVVYTNEFAPQFVVPNEPWVERVEPGLLAFLFRESQ